MLNPLWQFDRREMLRHLGLGLMGSTCASWLPALAEQVAADPRRKRHCILLWMSGGPTQTDTFDMKPGHNNGGEFKEIATRAPGLSRGIGRALANVSPVSQTGPTRSVGSNSPPLPGPTGGLCV